MIHGESRLADVGTVVRYVGGGSEMGHSETSFNSVTPTDGIGGSGTRAGRNHECVVPISDRILRGSRNTGRVLGDLHVMGVHVRGVESGISNSPSLVRPLLNANRSVAEHKILIVDMARSTAFIRHEAQTLIHNLVGVGNELLGVEVVKLVHVQSAAGAVLERHVGGVGYTAIIHSQRHEDRCTVAEIAVKVVGVVRGHIIRPWRIAIQLAVGGIAIGMSEPGSGTGDQGIRSRSVTTEENIRTGGSGHDEIRGLVHTIGGCEFAGDLEKGYPIKTGEIHSTVGQLGEGVDAVGGVGGDFADRQIQPLHRHTIHNL
mmetsp:Transcript_8910/g.16827  ORF Transcript_8910/g.16827 Transcript_8910/m.16827 type:complete len:316 (+) Transcript_8910:1003-1950(+)